MTGVGINPLGRPLALAARRVKDAAGTAQPLVLDAAGCLCYVLPLVAFSDDLFVVSFLAPIAANLYISYA